LSRTNETFGTYTLETYVYSYYNMCNISIYFCNIRIKHLKHRIATCLKMPKNIALPVAMAYLVKNYGGTGLPFLKTTRSGWGHKRKRKPSLPPLRRRARWIGAWRGVAWACGAARKGVGCLVGRSGVGKAGHAGEMPEHALHVAEGVGKRVSSCGILQQRVDRRYGVVKGLEQLRG
jgi:hypothetical protein